MPRTKQIESRMLDLPDPLSPVMALKCGSKLEKRTSNTNNNRRRLQQQKSVAKKIEWKDEMMMMNENAQVLISKQQRQKQKQTHVPFNDGPLGIGLEAIDNDFLNKHG